jgi:hypothetical protein
VDATTDRSEITADWFVAQIKQTVWKVGLTGFTNRVRHRKIGHGAHFRL